MQQEVEVRAEGKRGAVLPGLHAAAVAQQEVQGLQIVVRLVAVVDDVQARAYEASCRQERKGGERRQRAGGGGGGCAAALGTAAAVCRAPLSASIAGDRVHPEITVPGGRAPGPLDKAAGRIGIVACRPLSLACRPPACQHGSRYCWTALMGHNSGFDSHFAHRHVGSSAQLLKMPVQPPSLHSAVIPALAKHSYLRSFISTVSESPNSKRRFRHPTNCTTMRTAALPQCCVRHPHVTSVGRRASPTVPLAPPARLRRLSRCRGAKPPQAVARPFPSLSSDEVAAAVDAPEEHVGGWELARGYYKVSAAGRALLQREAEAGAGCRPGVGWQRPPQHSRPAACSSPSQLCRHHHPTPSQPSPAATHQLAPRSRFAAAAAAAAAAAVPWMERSALPGTCAAGGLDGGRQDAAGAQAVHRCGRASDWLAGLQAVAAASHDADGAAPFPCSSMLPCVQSLSHAAAPLLSVACSVVCGPCQRGSSPGLLRQPTTLPSPPTKQRLGHNAFIRSP